MYGFMAVMAWMCEVPPASCVGVGLYGGLPVPANQNTSLAYGPYDMVRRCVLPGVCLTCPNPPPAPKPTVFPPKPVVGVCPNGVAVGGTIIISPWALREEKL
jgi:hypothetical protein